MTAPTPSEIRFRVDPGDVPAEKAARRLHLSVERFQELLPRLVARGFPAADPDTGMYDLEAIDFWRRSRHGKQDQLASTAQNTRPFSPAKPSWEERLGGHREAQGA
jgi:hypothetical protein